MRWILLALALAGCARSTGAMNGGGGRDLGAGTGGGDGSDGGTGGNGAGDDLALATADLAAGASDLASGAADFASSVQDLAQPADLAHSSSDVVVHVLIDNFCNSSTNPTVINAPLHVPLHLTFENDSHDYDSDIWSSSGYGYLGLVQGGVWHDPIEHCMNAVPYTEYFDVGIAEALTADACPNYRLQIHCN